MGKKKKEENKKDGKEPLLQWHPAFLAGLQIELEADAPYLDFEGEHLLASKPMQIDVLIIKKERGWQVRKNIGRIFRTYNIIEYKSPEDSLSIDDFYKVCGYAYFYKSAAKSVDEVKVGEITISLVCSQYPRKLLRHFAERFREVRRREDGIYDIADPTFMIQLIVTKELSEKENLWLKNLTNDLENDRAAQSLFHAYRKHQSEKLYQSVMDVIIRANKERFEVNGMCEALEELLSERVEKRVNEQVAEQERILREEMKKKENELISDAISRGISQGISQGEKQKLLVQIKKKLEKGKSISQIADELEETEDVVLPLYMQLKAE